LGILSQNFKPFFSRKSEKEQEMAVENVWTGQKIWWHKWPWRDNACQKQ
jgi:hypothetical protein